MPRRRGRLLERARAHGNARGVRMSAGVRQARLPIAGCIALQLIALSCVDHDSPSRKRDHARDRGTDAAVDASNADGGARDASAEPDAEVGDAGSDASMQQRELNARLIDLLREVEREAFIRCPCLVAMGSYASEEACRDAVSFKPGWEACAEYVPVPADSDDALRCALTESQRRNDCVESDACDRDVLGRCRATTIECPKLDSQVLVRVLQWCPRYIMLFH